MQIFEKIWIKKTCVICNSVDVEGFCERVVRRLEKLWNLNLSEAQEKPKVR